MNKQILLILVLAAWPGRFPDPAAPGPIDPAGAPPATESARPPVP